jgi:hypothetical protein
LDWIALAHARRRSESIESAQAVLLRDRELHHDNAVIEINLAVTPAWRVDSKKQSNVWAAPSSSMRSFENWLSTTRTCDLRAIGLPSCYESKGTYETLFLPGATAGGPGMSAKTGPLSGSLNTHCKSVIELAQSSN